MVITFFGHASIHGILDIEQMVFNEIEHCAFDKHIVFYIGAQGDFDSIALRACERYKTLFGDTEIVLITPYQDPRYLQARKDYCKRFDSIIYPELENTPPKYAIIKRNRWMSDCADKIIFYVEHRWGGAAQMLDYAKKNNKNYVNLAD